MSEGNKLFPLPPSAIESTHEVTLLDTFGEALTLDVSVKVPEKGQDIMPADLVEKPQCRGDTSNEPDRFIFCLDCNRYRRIIPSCGQRNCPRCQLKQSRRLNEKYVPALSRIKTGYGRRWIAVTLTGYRIHQGAVGINVDIFAKIARRFLKERYLGGLIVVEHTWKPYQKEYYIHAHAFVLGDFMNFVQFSRDWGSLLLEEGLITFEEFQQARDDAIQDAINANKQKMADALRGVEGIHYTWLEDFRFDPDGHPRTNEQSIKKGLSYILKYVTKGVALENEDLEQVKGLRYISTFGEFYNMAIPQIHSRCRFCFDGKNAGKVGICYPQDIDFIEREKSAKGTEPLELVRVTSWPLKVIKERPEETEIRHKEIKEWWKARWRGVAFAWGHLQNFHWLMTGALGGAGNYV